MLSNGIEELVKVQLPGVYNARLLDGRSQRCERQDEGLASTTRVERDPKYVAYI